MNKYFLIGTAGHVDHGKTTLIKSLTGIDADRLEEEKKRGMTLDLGFAYMDIPGYGRVGIVDVPGHERFIKNMLSGIYAMDMVILVIDANEGVMPQTIEHLEILKLLHITNICVALTKIDQLRTIREDYDLQLKSVSDSIRSTFRDYSLSEPDIFPISCITGEGIEEFKKYLEKQCREISMNDRDEGRPLFMPVDRSFSVKGIGTVITGSVRTGELLYGRDYELYPGKRKAQIRNIQVHNEDRDCALTGQRCAVNISNLNKEDIVRGDILAEAGSLRDSFMLDVHMEVLESSPFPINNNSKVHFHYGSSENIAKVILMGADYLASGGDGYAQLRFETPVAVREGDRFIIRFISPLYTIGGGVILDGNPVKKRRGKKDWASSFEIKLNGTDKERIYEKISEHNPNLLSVHDIMLKDYITWGENRKIVLHSALKELEDEGLILLLDNKFLISSEAERRLRSFFLPVLSIYHKEHPSENGMNTAEAKMRLLGKGPEKEAGAIFRFWEDKKLIKEMGGAISLYDYELVICKDDETIRERLLYLYKEGGLLPPAYNDVKVTFLGSDRFKPAFNSLLKEKKLIKLDERYCVSTEAYDKALYMLMKMAQHMPDGFRLADYRDRLKCSRKVALAFLEYFDKKNITCKEGDIRRVTVIN